MHYVLYNSASPMPAFFPLVEMWLLVTIDLCAALLFRTHWLHSYKWGVEFRMLACSYFKISAQIADHLSSL
jgi:hypothetical protein